MNLSRIFARPGVIAASLYVGLCCSFHVRAGGLDLATAESLAIQQDPLVASMQARAEALSELEVAAGQLPDPSLKLGMVSLPLNSLDTGQEAMTQLQLGVVQTFPRGQTRSIRSAQMREMAEAVNENALDLALVVKRSVREAFIEVLKQQRLAQINRKAEAAFTDLEAITQEYYATGRVQQQDVLRAAVELAKVRERSVRISGEEQVARGRLAAWIGDSAWRELEPEWPVIEPLADTELTRRQLAGHPRIRALHRETLVAEKAIELAEQNYKPEFALDLTYGARSGTGPDGRQRPDLLSLMVRMDVPLFTGKRQDRIKAASIARTSATAFERDDAHRKMSSELDVHSYTLQRQQDRLRLYESSLLPEAEFNAQASFDAYQAALSDMTTLTRARIIEFDLQLDYAQLMAESLKSRARLLYLEGK